MFQRKNSTASEHRHPAPSPPPKGQSSSTSRLSGVFGLAGGSSRSRSTSELLTTEPQPIPASGHNCTATKNRTASVAGSLGAGLSVSHDSVFGLDISPESDAYFTQHRNQPAAESLPSSASLQYMSELRAAIGGRHRSAEDDEGLPRSPVNATPTTAQVLVDYSIHNNTAHSGGGSDPSLLSINSCELDEAPFVSLRNQQQQQAQPQQQSAKVFQRAGTTGNITEGRVDGGDDGLLGMAVALNHSAARHKISIRPKRNHAPARPRQLPQLAEGPIEDDLAWTSHPSGDAVQPHPSVPERKSRIGRLLRSEPVSGSSYKQRSISLSRTEESAIREAPVCAPSAVSGHVDPNSSSTKPSAGSSSVKLARSKSSVEKKIQHEVAVFWRRTKEGKLFQRRENPEKEVPANADQGGSKAVQQQAEPAEGKRKDLRKIKRDKEEKRKRSDVSANKEDSSPPFLSRIFGSRRSSRRLRKKNPPSPVPSHIPESRTPSPAAVPSEPLPVPKPRTVFPNLDDDEEMEIDWTIPNQPYSYAPPPSRSVPAPQSNRLVEKWAETDFQVRAPVASPKASRTEESLKMSPTPTRHHRIHIAGLSPYQRRVARIGNGLEISDDEWDTQEPTISPTRSYHFRADEKDSERKSGLSLNLENSMKSLPVNINQEFTLKKASPVLKPPPSETVAGENLRRSFEILKFSNEGLKKTIHSFNPKRISQSSDQLHLSDASGQRESSGSLSNSTSSLNISDGDDAADTNGSMNSVSVQSTEEKDVRDDVLIVNDHKEIIQHHPDWADYKPDAEEERERALSADRVPNNTTTADSSSSHPANVSESVRNDEPMETRPVIHPCGSNALQETEIRLKAPSPEEPPKPCKHKSWENRQLAAAAETPAMFSMSVRVQNPPDAKYKRSVSTPNSEASPSVHQSIPPEIAAVRKLSETFQPARPFIMSVRMGGVDGEGIPASLPPQQLMAKLSARPWQTKEEKDRQNKVALVRSQHVESEPPDAVRPEELESATPVEPVKLRPKTPAKEETSELLKVFARRSVKVRDSKDLTDALESSAEARNEILSGSIPPCRPSQMECVTKDDSPVPPADVIGQSVEKVDLSKEKMPLKKIAKPPVAIRTTIGEKPATIEPPTDRFLKSSARVQPFFRPAVQESTSTTDPNSLPSIRPFAPLFIRHPADDKNSSDPAEKSSKSCSPISPSQTDPVFEECGSDTNRIIETSTMSPDETGWKKHQTKSRTSDRFLSSHRFAAKTIDEEVKAATAVPPTRQSKVLDMVNNFQRLQVT